MLCLTGHEEFARERPLGMSFSCLLAFFFSWVKNFFFVKNSIPSGNASMLEFLFGAYSVAIFVLDFMKSDFVKNCNGFYFYIILVKK